jgi:hypothetical protein
MQKEGKRETFFEVLGPYLRRGESAAKKTKNFFKKFPSFLRIERKEEE